jgi:hypothetical protein
MPAGAPASSADAQIVRCRLSVALRHEFVANLGALSRAGVAGLLHCRDVHEHVRAACVRLDEAVAFGGIEKLHNSRRHLRIPSIKPSHITTRGGENILRLARLMHKNNRLAGPVPE